MAPPSKVKKLLRQPVPVELYEHVWNYKREHRVSLNGAIIRMLEEHRLIGRVNERIAKAQDALAQARRRIDS